jgi:hypothetical protein
VGAFTASASAYGTYDQGGNLWEWNDAVLYGSYRGNRGGSLNDQQSIMMSSFRNYHQPSEDVWNIGFRIAAVTSPSITSANTASGTVGIGFGGYAITASGFPLSYSATGLPTGLSVGRTTGIISGTPTQSGSFTVTLCATNVMGIGTAPLSLTINSPTLLKFRTGNTLALDGTQDLLTPAGDGVPNLLKYAFNMIGNGNGQATSLTIPNHSVLGLSGTSGLPASGINGSGGLTITYLRRKASSAPGIVYSVQFSNDISPGAWAVNVSATENVTSLDSDFERVTVTDNVNGTSRRFARVVVAEL